MKSVFNLEDSQEIISRINNLTKDSQALWGKMTVDQMLAHCNITYEMAFENIHPKPNAIKQFFLKIFIKNLVVSDKPYSKNSRTAPEFIISDSRDYEDEKKRLIHYITKTQELGGGYFEGRESHSFGQLKMVEWNNMFYKHLDHHLSQFGK